MKEVKIINDTYRLLKWILPILAKYPRNYRYSLGMRIENCLYELLELFQMAYLKESKSIVLTQADVKLEHLRLLIRLSHDLHLFDQTIHHAIIEQMEGIGKQLGGWQRSIPKGL